MSDSTEKAPDGSSQIANTPSVDAFADLSASGEAASVGVAQEVSASADAVIDQVPELPDVPICESGPCVNYIKIQRPSRLNLAQLVTERSCRLGVRLSTQSVDPRMREIPEDLAPSFSQPSFPVTCTGWRPLGVDEAAELDDLRFQAEERRREEVRVLVASRRNVSEAPVEDPGEDVPDARSNAEIAIAIGKAILRPEDAPARDDVGAGATAHELPEFMGDIISSAGKRPDK